MQINIFIDFWVRAEKYTDLSPVSLFPDIYHSSLFSLVPWTNRWVERHEESFSPHMRKPWSLPDWKVEQERGDRDPQKQNKQNNWEQTDSRSCAEHFEFRHRWSWKLGAATWRHSSCSFVVSGIVLIKT